jgi:hypothetical protein
MFQFVGGLASAEDVPALRVLSPNRAGRFALACPEAWVGLPTASAFNGQLATRLPHAAYLPVGAKMPLGLLLKLPNG